MGIQINGNTNNINAGIGSLSIEDLREIDIVGVATASNFKTGSSNLHSTGLTVGNNFIHSTGINVGTGATIHVPSSNVLTLGTNNNERVRVDSSGRLLVGSYAAANPKSSGAGSIDLDNHAFAIIVGGNHPSGGRSDNNAKTFRMSMVHNTLAEEPINILQGYCDSSDNNLYIGGGTGSANSLTQVRVYTGTNNTTTGGTERIRVNNAGAIGLSGANYGSSGQVLTSQGSGSAVSWTTITGTTINNNADNRLISGSDTANTLNGETYWYVSGASLALGTTSPAANFHMRNSYVSMRIDSDGSNNDTKFYNVTGTGKNNYIYFGDAADDDVGQIAYDHNGDHMKFIVGASERMRLNSNGLQFGGSNGSNHALDDYEEGEYTANLRVTSGSATFDSGSGNKLYYTKIGDIVYVNGGFSASSVSGAGGHLKFNLPFATKNSSAGVAKGAIGSIWNYYGSNNPYGNYGWYTLHGEGMNANVSNNITLAILGYNSQNSNWGPIGGLIGNNSQVHFSFTYRTN